MLCANCYQKIVLDVSITVILTYSIVGVFCYS